MAGEEERSGWISSALNWVLGGLGLGTVTSMVLAFFGQDSPGSLYERFAPQWLKNIINPIVDWFRNKWNELTGGVQTAVRNHMSPEQTIALNDIQARIDRFPAINELDAALGFGDSSISTEVRRLTKQSATEFFGANMPPDPQAVLTNAKTLQTRIHDYILVRLREQHPPPVSQELENRLEGIAGNAASYITGVYTENNENPRLLMHGYGGALIRVQTEVAKEGDYTAGQASASTVEPHVLERARRLAREVASGNITPTQDDAPAPPPGGRPPAEAPAR